MPSNKKDKSSPIGEQISLWDAVEEHPQQTLEVGLQAINPSIDPKIQDELNFLTKELEATKRKLAKVEAQLEQADAQNEQDRQALSVALIPLLPSLLLYEILKATALKETKTAIKPLKPAPGVAVSTNRSRRELGSIIGLSPAKAEKALQLLFQAGCAKQRGLTTIELGQFQRDTRGRVQPSWYADFTDPQWIMKFAFSAGILQDKGK